METTTFRGCVSFREDMFFSFSIGIKSVDSDQRQWGPVDKKLALLLGFGGVDFLLQESRSKKNIPCFIRDLIFFFNNAYIGSSRKHHEKKILKGSETLNTENIS